MNADFERVNVKQMLKDLQTDWDNNPGSPVLKHSLYKDRMDQLFREALSILQNSVIGYKALGMNTEDWFSDVLEWLAAQGFMVVQSDDPKRYLIKYHTTGTLSELSFVLDMHTTR